MASLIKPEAVQHQLVVAPQAQASGTDGGRALEAELVDARDDAGEQARASAVMVLFVVDDPMEMDDALCGCVVEAQ